MSLSSTPARFLSIVNVALLLLLAACSDDPVSVDGDPHDSGDDVLADPLADMSDWTPATHERRLPDHDIVFAQNVVQRLDLIISAENWQTMRNDMAAKYGPFGGGRGGPGGVTAENPVWVPATLKYNDITWYQIGVRFKGNSSLVTSWRQGIGKLAFKLDFDEFEDDLPQITNQRFYGFKQLSLSNGFEDTSLLREKVASDLFREAGVPAAHTAFYRVYIDHGNGPTYFGLYTMVEEVDDTVIDYQFDDGGGDLYKPDGDGASFAYGTFNESTFDKKTNEDNADWSDILALFDALHDDTRATDLPAWRSGLEAVLDTEGFLRWLAVNTVIQNWDTYGKMTHNYYLYHDPSSGRLTWIPWDNNEALQSGKQGGALSIGLSEVSDSWPLIRYLLDDPAYEAQYVAFVDDVAENVFVPSQMTERYQELHSLIQPYVTGNEGEQDGYTFLRSSAEFETSLGELIDHAESRWNVAKAYTGGQ